MLRPPTTNDPALNRFLEEVASTIQDRVRPEEGWTLSDFASSVSEVISDKRDLIDIVTKYDNIEGLSEEIEAEIDLLKSDIQDSMDLLSNVNAKSAEFTEVMEWWDQNYKVIFDAQEAMEIFGEISSALEGHQDILDQIAAATDVAENIVTEVRAAEASAKAAEEAAKTSEINAADAASRAESSADAAAADAAEVDEAREFVNSVHESLQPEGATTVFMESFANSAISAASQAGVARDAAAASATAAAADADRAESAAAGVDLVVSDGARALEAAIGVMAQEIADDADAADQARYQAEKKAGEAAASAATADSRATDAENAVASIAGHATDAEEAAGRAATSEANAEGSATAAAGSATAAASSATEAQGHADGARVAAIDAADQAVMEKFAEFLEGAPARLDTWMEVVDAIESGDSEMAALTAQLATKISGPYTIAVQAGGSPAAGTPSNQITFVTEVG